MVMGVKSIQKRSHHPELCTVLYIDTHYHNEGRREGGGAGAYQRNREWSDDRESHRLDRRVQGEWPSTASNEDTNTGTNT